MARRKKAEDPELPLFADLPLRPVEDGAAAPPESTPEPPDGRTPDGRTPDGRTPDGRTPESPAPEPPPAPAQTDLFAGSDRPPAVEVPAARPAAAAAAPLVERLRSGLADLAVQLMMLAVAITAAYRLGVTVTLEYWPPFALLALDFSFLYWVVPLAFWGQTPGMAWVGHLARAMDDEPLTFGQALRRWIGALLTLSLAGLPLLLALGGRSLSDRLSDSKSVKLEP